MRFATSSFNPAQHENYYNVLRNLQLQSCKAGEWQHLSAFMRAAVLSQPVAKPRIAGTHYQIDAV
jgi:hypothetical protein